MVEEEFDISKRSGSGKFGEKSNSIKSVRFDITKTVDKEP
jgi:hypothetical protein